jgi:hypothetical protein
MSISAVFALKKCVLHFIVDQNQPFLRGSGTLPKVICLDLKLTRSLLSSAQLRRKFVCEVHGSRAIFLGSFSRFSRCSTAIAFPRVSDAALLQ